MDTIFLRTALALGALATAACGPSRTTAYVCETDEQRQAAVQILETCTASARWSEQVRQCERVAKRTACTEVQGFQRPGSGEVVACSMAVSDAERKVCAP